MRAFFIGLVGACALTATASGATFHVSPHGDDANKGSASRPLRTISAAAQLAQPGDTVLVAGGIYRERVAPPRGGQPGSPIVYRAAPGQRAIVRGSEIWQPNWTDEGDGLFSAVPDGAMFDDQSPEYIDGHNPLKVELASTPWHRDGRREAERRDAGEGRIHECDERIVYTCGQVFVNGEQYLEVPLQAELKPRTWHYDPKGGRVHVHFGKLQPAEQQVELTTRRRLFAPKTRGLGHIVVEGFVFEHCGNQYPTNFWMNDAYAQKGAVGTEAGHHWTIRRNVIRHCKTFALDVGRVDRHSKRRGSHDNVVEENYILENGSAGILSNASENLVIRDNVILRNNTLRFLGIKRWEQAGIKCHHFKNGLIQGNYVAENYDTYGVWLDNQFPNCRVSRNIIHSNGRSGIFLEMSDYEFDRLTIDNNIVLDNFENAVYIHDASGATFLHNLLANTRRTTGYGQAVLVRQVMARTKTYHHSFFNNLILANAHNVEVNYPAARSGLQRFDHNVYGVEQASKKFFINRKSNKPAPWTVNEFAEIVSADIGLDVNQDDLLDESARAPLSFERWQTFWQRHGQANDRQSKLDPSGTVKYDRSSHELVVRIGVDPRSVGSRYYTNVTTDFFGKPLPDSGESAAGPFQDIQQGENRFTIWDGLPIVGEDELPPVDCWD